ncbi:MAG: hypothetical protein ABR581_01790 [Thermoleophilaceae bacterium]
MSVVIRFKPQNLTKDTYDKASEKIEEALDWPPDGLDYHVCFGEDGDLKVSEIWDSREQAEAFQQKLMPLLEEAGVHFGDEMPEVYEVHGLEKRGG